MPTAFSTSFRHDALLYDDEAAFLAGTVPFIRTGLEAGEPVMAVVSAAKIALLQQALGSDAEDVRFADMAGVGANPARIIPVWRTFLEEHGGRPVRGIGEPIWAERTPEELVECQLHEALLNHAFAGADGFHLLCPYDTSALDPPVLSEAACAHPTIVTVERRQESLTYRGPHARPPAAEAPLAAPPAAAGVLSFDVATLTDAREQVEACARGAGLDDTAAGELVLAVHELATNSIQHGGGMGVLRTWVADDVAVCEIRDRGHIADPLAGRHPPRLDQTGGWGLWIAHLLCDLVQIRSGPAGTTVRVRRAGT